MNQSRTGNARKTRSSGLPYGIPMPYLREWRMFRMYSQMELAKLAGLSNLTISHIESGRTASFTTVRAVATALNLTPEQLRFEVPPLARRQE